MVMKSDEYKIYLRKRKLYLIFTYIAQIVILISFIFLWEYLSRKNIINSFIYSSPIKVVKTIIDLYNKGTLFKHIWVTSYETIISFLLATLLGTVIAIILWYSKFLYKVMEPYLTVLNSLPKVSLGPIIIILCGANIKSIIIMALLISLIITITSVHSGFINTDKNMIKLMNSLKASKWQILKLLIIPYNYHVIISSLKINVGLSLVGVIMGEFLVSKNGIGYLINYGSQVFNLDLVFAGIVILLIVSYLLYLIVLYIERALTVKS
jgi:NitT/TauT family transport system permease protein